MSVINRQWQNRQQCTATGLKLERKQSLTVLTATAVKCQV